MKMIWLTESEVADRLNNWSENTISFSWEHETPYSWAYHCICNWFWSGTLLMHVGSIKCLEMHQPSGSYADLDIGYQPIFSIFKKKCLSLRQLLAYVIMTKIQLLFTWRPYAASPFIGTASYRKPDRKTCAIATSATRVKWAKPDALSWRCTI